MAIWILSVYLAALYGVATYLQIGLGGVGTELVRMGALAGGLFIPHMGVWFLSKTKPKVANLLVTLFILLLLASWQTSPILMFVLGLVAFLIKTLLRWHNQPIFNPAGAALFFTSFLGLSTTWWGVSFAPRLPIFNMSVAMLLTLPIGLYLIWKYKKIPTLVSVCVSFAGLYLLLRGRLPLLVLLEGTFAFFLLIMATEPKTTPLVDWQEWIYGLILGAVLAFLFVSKAVAMPYLTSLLVLNLLFWGFRWMQLKLVAR